MDSLDALLTEMHGWDEDRRHHGAYLVRRFTELGAVKTAPTIVAPSWFRTSVAQGVHDIAHGWTQSSFFPGLRLIERLGLAEIEHDDTYVLAMISSLGSRWLRDDMDVRVSALRADPELLELVWRVFEVEGNREISLTNVDKYSMPGATWADTFHTLVADGTLKRDRVQRGCLDALARDFSAYRAGWFSRMYVSLRPSAAERADHQPALLRLLGSAVPATVSFAVTQLAAIAKLGTLDDDAFLAQCRDALLLPTRSSPLTTVKILTAIPKRRPDLTVPVVRAIAIGLEHARADVQGTALEVLRGLPDGESVARDEVAARLVALEPSVSRAAAEWLGISIETTPVEEPVAVVPRRVPDETVAELGARLLAGHLDGLDVERFIARLASGDIDGLHALAKQAGRVVKTENWLHGLRRAVATLILTEPGAPTGVGPNETILSLRLGEVREILAGRRAPRALLATPTDRAGWLDPGEFVARLASSPDPLHHDLIAALLRLHPEGRSAALPRAKDLAGEAGAATRYALGGEAAPVGTPPLWVAAARSRAPLADDAHLIAWGLDGAGQGRAAAYSLAVTSDEHSWQERGKTRSRVWYSFALQVDPPAAPEAPDQPTVVGSASHWADPEPDWIDWQARIWPHDAETFFADRVGAVIDAASVLAEVNYWTGPALAALSTHPGRLGPMAATTLAAGLSAKELQFRVLATDAFAHVVPAGRITAGDLAAAMAHIAGHCTATRWAATLRDAARATPQAATAVGEVLAALLPNLSRDHPGGHALIEALFEETVRSGHRPEGAALRTWLGEITGSSKAGIAAKALLAELTTPRGVAG